MSFEIYRYRNKLTRTLQALKYRQLTIGFIGGSITDPRSNRNWPEYVTNWLVETFPDVRIIVENAAIGATGSDLAIFRAKRDLIDRGCDLVFVEYAVNDNDIETERRTRTREGLIRQLLGAGIDIVLAYTYNQDMYRDIAGGIVPSSIKEFELLAEYYGVGSVWMGLYALEKVKKGGMRWEQWLSDGVHPAEPGSLCYAQSAIEYLERELLSDENELNTEEVASLPAPMNCNNWENVCIVPFQEVETIGPWRTQRSSMLVWMDQMLMTSAIDAEMSFEFEGRGLCLGFDFGKLSSEFQYCIDSGEWITECRERPVWCQPSGWYRLTCITDELTRGRHKFQLKVIHGDNPQCVGTTCCIALIGVIA